VRTVDDLIKHGVAGRRILVRSDLNVPVQDGRVADAGRIRASLPVLTKLLDRGARVIVTAHLGRPAGQPDPQYSLRPVADRLAQLLGRPVEFALDTVGESARLLACNLNDGELLLLENVRFNAAETSKDDRERAGFAWRLAMLTGGDDDGGAFVEDAFGAVHRRHASVYDVAKLLPHYCGDLVRDELAVLRRLTDDAHRPYAVVLGGAKVSDKLPVITALLPQVDTLLIGGGMCFTFLAAQGHEVGKSLLETDQVDTCKGLLAEAADKIVLPTDIVVAPEASATATATTVAAGDVPADQLGLDIGPESVRLFADRLAGARTVFWNGPMGVFELAPFASGTKGVAEAVAAVDGLSVVGGGDSAAAVRALGLDEHRFGHISTGGGASLDYLEGKPLPGVTVLDEP
jgi:phosphoglycerate kinase